MPRPYSNDLRERAIAEVISGKPTRLVAKQFGIAVSSVIKWHQLYRETGSVSPAQMGNPGGSKLDKHEAFILHSVKVTPHLTVTKLRSQLLDRSVKVSRDTVWRFMRRKGLSFKKKR